MQDLAGVFVVSGVFLKLWVRGAEIRGIWPVVGLASFPEKQTCALACVPSLPCWF
jgi:hypothetical protein